MCQGRELHGCMVRCARWGCNRPFVVCERCEQGQRYCSDDCRRAARQEQVRRAKRKHGRSFKGRVATSKRNRRLRAGQKARGAKSLRKIETDHPSTQDPAGVTDALDELRATPGSPVGAEEGPCHDVNSQQPRVHHQTLGLPGRVPSLDQCRFCGARVHLFVDRDKLRTKAAVRRRDRGRRRERRPRLPVGPGG